MFCGQGYNLTVRQTSSATRPGPARDPRRGDGGPCSTRSSRAPRWSTAREPPGSSPTWGSPAAASSPSAPSTSPPPPSSTPPASWSRPASSTRTPTTTRSCCWDPTASPSSVHGVTTVIGGNCGFTLAPLRDGDADYLRRMMARVEGMPLAALEQGVDWKWDTFAEYLDRFEGSIAVNAGFLAGHCAIRRYVMGEDAVGSEATPDQIAEMRAELGRALDAGALGLLLHPVVVAQRRRRRTGREQVGDPRGARRAQRGDRCPPGHHARGHRAGLPRPVLGRRDRTARCGERGGQPTAELERPHRRRARAGARRRASSRPATAPQSSAAASSRSRCRCRSR